MRVLVTGATGYIGGRLVPRLLERGHQVRVLVRDPDRIARRPWECDVEVFQGDLLQQETLAPALEGIDAAYYLVHSMHGGKNFEDLDRQAAKNFAQTARGIDRLVYLGGLIPRGNRVSPHLKSRGEVGQILRSRLPTTELRAGPVIGSGSAPFEMVRYLTERLPFMITPKWMENELQPISIRDILNYLLQTLDRDSAGVVEVGADPLPFRRLFEVYAEVRRYRRVMISFPFITPTLAARWVALVTPIPMRLAVPLIQGVISPLFADTTRARELFPQIRPMSYEEAVELALMRIRRGEVETRWSGSLGTTSTYELQDWEGMIREVRSLHVNASPERVFGVFSRLGGDVGWLTWNWAWKIRGLFDKLIGGPGLRRGRRDPVELLPGEAVDFWRVETVSCYTLLRLRAEMKVPGRAWMQWEVMPDEDGTRLIQTAMFAPKGLRGQVYWHSLYPIHRVIFSDMVRAVAREAEDEERASRVEPPGP